MNRDRATVYTVLFYLFVHMCMSARLHKFSHYMKAANVWQLFQQDFESINIHFTILAIAVHEEKLKTWKLMLYLSKWAVSYNIPAVQETIVLTNKIIWDNISTGILCTEIKPSLLIIIYIT